MQTIHRPLGSIRSPSWLPAEITAAPGISCRSHKTTQRFSSHPLHSAAELGRVCAGLCFLLLKSGGSESLLFLKAQKGKATWQSFSHLAPMKSPISCVYMSHCFLFVQSRRRAGVPVPLLSTPNCHAQEMHTEPVTQRCGLQGQIQAGQRDRHSGY